MYRICSGAGLVYGAGMGCGLGLGLGLALCQHRVMAIVSATRLLDVTEDDHRLGRTLDSELGTLDAQPQAMVLVGVWWAMVGRMVGVRRARENRCVGAAGGGAVAVVAPRVARSVVATDAMCCAGE